MPLHRHLRPRTSARLLTIAAVGFGLLAPVGAANAESLTDALVQTYRNNPTIRAARAELRATNERVPQELSNWRPQVSIDTSISRQSIEDEDQFSTTDEDTTPKSATLRVQQPVYRGGQTFAGVDRAENEVVSQRKRLLSTQQDVFQRAVEAYLNVWRDREVLRLNQENVRALREQLKATQERFKRGVVTRTDVAQAKSRLARAKARRENTRGQLSNSQALYEELIGQPPGDLSYPGDMARMPTSLEATVARAAERNPQILAARFASKAADRAVRQRTGQLLPSVTLTGEVQRQEETIRPSDETERAEVRLRMQIPLYQAGQVTSQIRQAKQTASQRRLQTAEADRRARQQAHSAWGRLESAREQIGERRTQVESAKVALEGMEEELNVGSRTVIEVLDAEQDLFNARISLVRARRDIAVARFGVLSAIGGLTARDLDLNVAYYDPRQDYEEVRNDWWSLYAPNAEAATNTGARETSRRSAATGMNEAARADAEAHGEAAQNGAVQSETAESETAETAPKEAAAESPDAPAEAAETAESETAETAPKEAAAESPDAPAEAAAPGGKAAIRDIERLLKKLDFQTGPVDGKIDPKTRAAIGQFQSAAGLPVTYKADAALLRELRAVAGEGGDGS